MWRTRNTERQTSCTRLCWGQLSGTSACKLHEFKTDLCNILVAIKEGTEANVHLYLYIRLLVKYFIIQRKVDHAYELAYIFHCRMLHWFKIKLYSIHTHYSGFSHPLFNVIWSKFTFKKFHLCFSNIGVCLFKVKLNTKPQYKLMLYFNDFGVVDQHNNVRWCRVRDKGWLEWVYPSEAPPSAPVLPSNNRPESVSVNLLSLSSQTTHFYLQAWFVLQFLSDH